MSFYCCHNPNDGEAMNEVLRRLGHSRVGYDLDGTLIDRIDGSLRTRPSHGPFVIVTGRAPSRCLETKRDLHLAGINPVAVVFTGIEDASGNYVDEGRFERKAAAVRRLGLREFHEDKIGAVEAILAACPEIKVHEVALAEMSGTVTGLE